jgi:hypothetical protein
MRMRLIPIAHGPRVGARNHRPLGPEERVRHNRIHSPEQDDRLHRPRDETTSETLKRLLRTADPRT